MTDGPQAAAVIYAKDVGRIVAFYAGLLGVAPARPEPGYVLLESPAMQLIVVAIPDEIASSIDIASPPVRREDTPIKLVLPVETLAVSREVALGLGGILDSPEREWRFQGARVCDGHDPEGNVVQLREIAVRPAGPATAG